MYEQTLPGILLALFILTALGLLAWLAARVAALERKLRDPVATLAPMLEEKAPGGAPDLHAGLTQQGDRLGRHLMESSEHLSAKIDQRLDQIGGKVNERLHGGFGKTNETFVICHKTLAGRLAAASMNHCDEKHRSPHVRAKPPHVFADY
jgi:hypothetical protein